MCAYKVGGKLVKKCGGKDVVGNNEVDAKVRRLEMDIATQKRATQILNEQTEMEVLDLEDYGQELDDALMCALASQLTDSGKDDPNDIIRKLVLTGCSSFTAIGMRALTHAIGNQIRHLVYSKTNIPIELLQVLGTGIEGLDELDFSGCYKLTTESIRIFIECCSSSVTKINLSHCPVLNDDALGWIGGTLGPQGSLTRCVHLHSLDLSYARKLGDRGLRALASGCRQLLFLNLEGLTAVSDRGMLQLVQGCRKLRVLSLKRCSQLSNDTLRHIGNFSKQLRTLNVALCAQLSSEGIIDMVRGTSKLQSLNIAGCLMMTEEVLAAVATNCLGLHTLVLTGCQDITESGIHTLAEHLPYVCISTIHRGLSPAPNALTRKFSTQEKTIRNSAALRIQAFYRGYVGRKIAKVWRAMVVETPAKSMIRRAYSNWVLRREINNRALRSAVTKRSAILIQARIRGILSRRKLESYEKDQKRLSTWAIYAVKVQAAYRGHWTRKHWSVVHKTIMRFRMEQQLLERLHAVKRLQRAYRARFNRSRLDDLLAINKLRRRERIQSAVVIQRYFRSRAARKAFRQMLDAVQAYQRQQMELKRAVVRVQSQWRANRSRNRMLYLRSEMNALEKLQNEAATTINASVRGYYGRRIAQKRRLEMRVWTRAAVSIQRAWKWYKTPAQLIRYNQIKHQLQLGIFDEVGNATTMQNALVQRGRRLAEHDSASEEEDDDDWQDYMDENGGHFWFSPSQDLRVDVRPSEHPKAKAILGLYCRVYWPLEEQWFPGRVLRYNRGKRKHRVSYDDGDHEWLHILSADADRVQLYNGYAWCMTAMFEPTHRALKAVVFVGFKVKYFDSQWMTWKEGEVSGYDDASGCFLVRLFAPDNSTETIPILEWVDLVSIEDDVMIQNRANSQWYSLSGFVYGSARGRPVTKSKLLKGSDGIRLSVKDYLNGEVPRGASESDQVTTNETVNTTPNEEIALVSINNEEDEEESESEKEETKGNSDEDEEEVEEEKSTVKEGFFSRFKWK